MRKQALLLMAGGMLAFASCNTETTSGVSDAQVDSIVNARVEEIRLEMMHQNDSQINAMAQAKADSAIAAMKGGKSVTAKAPTTTRTKAVEAQGTGTTTTSRPGTGTVNIRQGAGSQSGQTQQDRPANINQGGSQTIQGNPGERK